MAALDLLVVSIVALLVLSGARADAGVGEDEIVAAAGVEEEPLDSPLLLELEQLRSKISALESSISVGVRELKSKEESITRLEAIIQEKSESIASLQSEVESIQKKGVVDKEELVGRALARAGELEKQVERLKNEIEVQIRKRDALESRAIEAEKKLHELNSKLENIHEAWLPPWLAAHMYYCRDLLVTHWNEHAKSALNAFLQKASEKSVQVQKWAEPHLEKVKTKWIPALKKQTMISITYVKPHLQKVSIKTIEFYETSKSTIAPHIAKVQEVADPYLQEVKKFSKPYIDRVAVISKPHVETVRVALKPYTKHVVRVYQKFLKLTTAYHRQVQATVMEKLKKHELTKPLANKELVWFMVSALLAFPIFYLYRLLSAIFCKKARKPTQNAHSSHVSRRHKRRHADK